MSSTAPITTDHVNLVQPLNGGRNRWITEVDLTFDGGQADRSRSTHRRGRPAARRSRSRCATFSTFEIRVTATTTPGSTCSGSADAVGFAEIRLRDRTRGPRRARRRGRADAARSPRRRSGTDAAAHPLVLVMNREALRPVPPRTDPERGDRSHLRAARRADVRAHRHRVGESRRERFARSTVRSACGRRSRPRPASRCPGCIQCRASAATDGDPSTAWNTPFVGVSGQWVQVEAPHPITFDRMHLQVVADGRHSVPTQLELEVDGAVRQLDLPPIRESRAGERHGDRSAALPGGHRPANPSDDHGCPHPTGNARIDGRHRGGSGRPRRARHPGAARRARAGRGGGRVPLRPAHDRRPPVSRARDRRDR